MNDVVVSIACVTYNHEKFIAQAIESVLMQKTNFKFELIIGEDCSTDNTAKIVKQYAEKYPEIIKARCNPVNLGMTPNGIKTLQECKGKYLALLDGDDYWTDPLKLQKQVDFLEANPDFAMCFHLSKIWDEEKKTFVKMHIKQVPEVTDIEYLAQGHYVHTHTVLYRKNETALHDFYEMHPAIGDFPLCILHARYGKIMKFEDKMAVYRLHKNGSWSGVESDIQTLQSIRMLDSMFPYFDNNICAILDNYKSRLYISLFQWYLNNSAIEKAQKLYNATISETQREKLLNLLFEHVQSVSKISESFKNSRYFKLKQFIKQFV